MVQLTENLEIRMLINEVRKKDPHVSLPLLFKQALEIYLKRNGDLDTLRNQRIELAKKKEHLEAEISYIDKRIKQIEEQEIETQQQLVIEAQLENEARAKANKRFVTYLKGKYPALKNIAHATLEKLKNDFDNLPKEARDRSHFHDWAVSQLQLKGGAR